MSALYTPQMLALAADLARYPFAGEFAHQASARSSVCGSTLAIGLDLDADGAVSRVGLQVAACAIGQSSAAILAGAAQGARPEDIATVHEGVRAWLSGEGDLPDWPGLEILTAARAHAGRHGALLLPWEAAVRALDPVLSATPRGAALPTRRSAR